MILVGYLGWGWGKKGERRVWYKRTRALGSASDGGDKRCKIKGGVFGLVCRCLLVLSFATAAVVTNVDVLITCVVLFLCFWGGGG